MGKRNTGNKKAAAEIACAIKRERIEAAKRMRRKAKQLGVKLREIAVESKRAHDISRLSRKGLTPAPLTKVPNGRK